MEQYRRQLQGQRDALDQQLSALDQALRALGGSGGGFGGMRGGGSGSGARGGGGRAAEGAGGGDFRPGSLKHYIARVLSSGETRTVKDISQAVIDSGYKTKNRTLPTSVGLALAEMPNVRKVARGTYRLK